MQKIALQFCRILLECVRSTRPCLGLFTSGEYLRATDTPAHGKRFSGSSVNNAKGALRDIEMRVPPE